MRHKETELLTNDIKLKKRSAMEKKTL